jgi:predicted nucleic acid-binding protein
VKLAYLDASAVVKLFKPEVESEALTHALNAWPVRASSELLAVEARCAARRLGGADVLERAESTLERISLIACSEAIQARAGREFTRRLRALDAIHAATALALGDVSGVAFVYDVDLAAAMAAEGLEVASPGAS